MINKEEQKMIWCFENVLSETEQIKRINEFNNLAAEIGANSYIQREHNEKK